EVLKGRPSGSDGRPRMLNFLGVEAESRGDLSGAADLYARAAEADPSHFEYPYKLSLVLRRLGRKEEAEARLAERERLRKARTELREAWNAFADVYDSNPQGADGPLLVGMARACEAVGWRREALAWYREAFRAAPDDPAVRKGLGRLEAGPSG